YRSRPTGACGSIEFRLGSKSCGDLFLGGDAGDARRDDDVGRGGVGVANSGKWVGSTPARYEEGGGEDVARASGILLLGGKCGDMLRWLSVLSNGRAAQAIGDDHKGDAGGPRGDQLFGWLTSGRHRHILDAANQRTQMRQHQVGSMPGHGIDAAL